MGSVYAIGNRSTMKHLVRLIATLAVCLAAALAGVTSAQAKPPVNYVALGDSFSAGTGAIAQLSDYDFSDNCLRSKNAYPRLIAAAAGWNLHHDACQGATTADVSKQLGNLSKETDVVTITIGGNDIGFIPVVVTCATPGTTKDCLKVVAASEAAIVFKLPSALKKVYAAIKKAAPNARVIAVGYPRLFNGTDCSGQTDYTPIEQAAMNVATDLLNASIAVTAAKAGVEFANPRSTFKGHAWCDKKAWINPPDFFADPPVNAGSLHPNIAGQAGYAEVVGSRLRY